MTVNKTRNEHNFRDLNHIWASSCRDELSSFLDYRFVRVDCSTSRFSDAGWGVGHFNSYPGRPNLTDEQAICLVMLSDLEWASELMFLSI